MGNQAKKSTLQYLPEKLRADNNLNVRNHTINNKVDFYLEAMTIVTSKNLFNTWKEQLKKIFTPSSHYFFFLPIQSSYESIGLCGDNATVRAIYPLFPYTLQTQIITRQKNQIYFSSQEIWLIMYIMIWAAAYFHRRGLFLESFGMDSIFISEEGKMKIKGGKRSFLSQFLGESEQDSMYFTESQIKQECNEIGLTLLNIVALQHKTLAQISQVQPLKADSALLAIIQGLCEQKIDKRLTCEKLLLLLSPFSEKILNLSSFPKDSIRKQLKFPAIHFSYSSKIQYKKNIEQLVTFTDSLFVSHHPSLHSITHTLTNK